MVDFNIKTTLYIINVHQKLLEKWYIMASIIDANIEVTSVEKKHTF